MTLSRLRTLALMLSLVIPFRAAAAHARLVKANPAAGARVAAPRFVVLTFSEPLTAALCRVTLLDAAMKPVALNAVKPAPGDPKTIAVGTRGPLAAGRYTVKWQVAGDDGHPVRGQYAFDVEERTADAGVPPPHDEQEPVFGVESPAYVALRAIQAAVVIALMGVLELHFLVGPQFARIATRDGLATLAAVEHAAVRWVIPLLTVLLAAEAGRLVAQHAALFGTREMPTLASLSGILLASLWGRGWLLAIGSAIVGLVAARRLQKTKSAGWEVLAAVVLVVSFSMAMSGHAAAASAFAMTLQALHVVGAGGWVGSLGILMLVAVPVVLRSHGDERHLIAAGLVRAFSPSALACAGLVAATGIVAAWRNIGSLSALYQSRYGQVLLAKVAVLSIAGLTGFYNWRYALPTLGSATATGRLRRSAAVELAAAVLVLVVTAVLVAIPMPAETTSIDP